MRRPKTALAPAAGIALSILTATTLAAQDSGSITGTLDLEPARWTLSGGDAVPDSTWSDTEDGIRFVLHAYPQAEPDSVEDSIEIAFFARGMSTEADVTDSAVHLQRIVQGQTLIAASENIDITLETLVRQGDRIVIAGSLVAVMTPGGTSGLAVSPENDVTFDGNFQATVDRSK